VKEEGGDEEDEEGYGEPMAMCMSIPLVPV
jgi:hypothetical protein